MVLLLFHNNKKTILLHQCHSEFKSRRQWSSDRFPPQFVSNFYQQNVKHICRHSEKSFRGFIVCDDEGASEEPSTSLSLFIRVSKTGVSKTIAVHNVR